MNGTVHSFVHESKEGHDVPVPPPWSPNIRITSNKCETIFLSSAGDVLSSRCRMTPYPPLALNASGTHRVPYQWTDDLLCCDARVETGLKGGAPAAEVAPVRRHASRRVAYEHGGEAFPPLRSERHPTVDGASSKESPNSVSSMAVKLSPFRSAPMQFDSGNPEEEESSSIVPIKSFDYSQFHEGDNDARPHDDSASPKSSPPLFHGIPTFLSCFTNIQVRHVSAHPLGAHVLLISQPGLLYSYGCNRHGQLGMGVVSRGDVHHGYILQPTVVTPLLEHGGKAVVCAAGVTHSLVVVELDEGRLLPTTTKKIKGSDVLRHRSPDNASRAPSTPSTSTTTKHHQVYGFGRNDQMKMGLVSPQPIEGEECLPLPRRVALRCSVVQPSPHYSSSPSSTTKPAVEGTMLDPPMGIFALAASVEHSAALVRRSSGEVALYTWGNATFGALGLPEPETVVPSSTAAFCIVPVPTLVAPLSQSAPSSLLRTGECPVQVSLSRCCSFVVTNQGRCFSFGTSEDGLLGLGREVTATHTPLEVPVPEPVASVSAGAAHVSVATRDGRVYSWGARGPCGFPRSAPPPPVVTPRKLLLKGPTPMEELLPQCEWSPRPVVFSSSSMDRSRNHSLDRSSCNASESDAVPIVLVHAGHDASFFVTERGLVLSAGQSSGRLGQGETTEGVITTPRPLFGGLQLFLSDGENHPPLTSGPSRRMASA